MRLRQEALIGSTEHAAEYHGSYKEHNGRSVEVSYPQSVKPVCRPSNRTLMKVDETGSPVPRACRRSAARSVARIGHPIQLFVPASTRGGGTAVQ